jgi:hypothetical protein
MNRVFVDTAALIALGNKQDRWHDKAVAISRQLTLAGCRFVTTDAVLNYGENYGDSLLNILIASGSESRKLRPTPMIPRIPPPRDCISAKRRMGGSIRAGYSLRMVEPERPQETVPQPNAIKLSLGHARDTAPAVSRILRRSAPSVRRSAERREIDHTAGAV